LRWIVRLRWGAVAGQVITILIARQFVRKPLPIVPLLGVCAALALGNLAVQIWLDRGGRPTDRACALNLLADIAALTALLGLSAAGRTRSPCSTWCTSPSSGDPARGLEHGARAR